MVFTCAHRAWHVLDLANYQIYRSTRFGKVPGLALKKGLKTRWNIGFSRVLIGLGTTWIWRITRFSTWQSTRFAKVQGWKTRWNIGFRRVRIGLGTPWIWQSTRFAKVPDFGTQKGLKNTVKHWFFTCANRAPHALDLAKYQIWHLAKYQVCQSTRLKNTVKHRIFTCANRARHALDLAKYQICQSTRFWHSKKTEKHGKTLDFHVCASGSARLGFGKVPGLAKYQIWHFAKYQIWHSKRA